MKHKFCLSLILVSFLFSAQPLIHAHNDYQKPEPLTNALRNKVFTPLLVFGISSLTTLIVLTNNRKNPDCVVTPLLVFGISSPTTLIVLTNNRKYPDSVVGDVA